MDVRVLCMWHGSVSLQALLPQITVLLACWRLAQQQQLAFCRHGAGAAGQRPAGGAGAAQHRHSGQLRLPDGRQVTVHAPARVDSALGLPEVYVLTVSSAGRKWVESGN